MKKLAFALLLGVAVGAPSQDKRDERKLLPTELSRKIDSVVQNKWSSLRVNRAELSDDYEFLRRVTLDLIGRAPRWEETLEFVKSKDKLKREKKIEDLISSDAFVEHWADLWTNILYGYTNAQYSDRGLLKEWIAEKLSKNAPYDKMVRELVAAQGSHTVNKATNFALRWLANGGPDELTKRISKVFLGVRLNCASCHDHPLDIWKREDFFGMEAFFNKTSWKTVGDKDKDKVWVLEDDTKNARNMKYVPKGFTKPVGPTFLKGIKPQTDLLREEFAMLLVSNPQFDRAIANRLWAHFFGRGIVDPVDDFTMKNRPILPELLDDLAHEFRENGFDFKYMVRSIVNTKIYQQSSRVPENQDKNELKAAQHWAHMPLKMLTPSVLFETIVAATQLDQVKKPSQVSRLRKEFINLLAPSFEDEFADQREFNTSVQQIMRLMTWEDLYQGIGGVIAKIVAQFPGDRARIKQVYIAMLCREPSEKELETCLGHLKKMDDEERAYAEIAYALLNTNEFFFNH